MPDDETLVEPTADGSAGEILSCVTCRNRKLKCDRTKPTCTRCAKVKGECVYPESRRKPAFKRRNVRELEARLAQVEVQLKEASENKNADEKDQSPQRTVNNVDFTSFQIPMTEDVLLQGLDFTEPAMSFDGFNGDGAFSFNPAASTHFDGASNGQMPDSNPFAGELIDLGGLYESLPSMEVMEDLNRLFFERQQWFIPVIHPARYLHAFYSAPHMRPPMCLQYAIWALASHGQPKYEMYHDVFYKRARQYAEADELKGYGEHFITVSHAQAWTCIAIDEAKMMLYTRAAMSCARGVRLAQMMGLHRLDSDPDEMLPTLVPPRDWAELEERRRTFWGLFCTDSHASVSTGWPHLIDPKEITTRLPADESSFLSGVAKETCRLQDAFGGETYSSFAGTVLICHMFNTIMQHIHRPEANDNAENYEYGEFWNRHRMIDNTLSSAFMFLPQSFRLPENYRDATAIQQNLNLHASTICLHHAALEKIDLHQLPEAAKKSCQDRLCAAAQEIINIVKLTSHVASNPKTPMSGLSLYCAASVYVYLCKEMIAEPTHIANLDFTLAAMEAMSRDHFITRAFLRQLVLDIEFNEIQDRVRLPRLGMLGRSEDNPMAKNIPLLARSAISRHSKMQPVLPGRLPLGDPIGKIIPEGVASGHLCYDFSSNPSEITAPAVGNKRKRTTPSSLDSSPENTNASWTMGYGNDAGSSTPLTHSSSPDDNGNASFVPLQTSLGTGGPQHADLPHRTNTISSSDRDGRESSNAALRVAQQSNGNRRGVQFGAGLLGNFGPSPFVTAGREPDQTRTTKGGQGTWDLAGMCIKSQFVDQRVPTSGVDSWGLTGDEDPGIDWANLGASTGMENGSAQGESMTNAAYQIGGADG